MAAGIARGMVVSQSVAKMDSFSTAKVSATWTIADPASEAE